MHACILNTHAYSLLISTYCALQPATGGGCTWGDTTMYVGQGRNCETWDESYEELTG